MRIVCLGAGNVGAELAKSLAADKHEITVIDQDQERLSALEAQTDTRTLCGNAGSLMVLEAGEVGTADLVLCVTGNDETNMLSCLLSRSLGATRSIVRLKNQEYLSGRRYFYRKILGCDFFISPEELASEEICKVIREQPTTAVETFADGRVQVRRLRLEEESQVLGKKLQDLNLPNLCLIVAIFRQNEILIPTGQTILQSEDHVLVAGASQGFEEILQFFGGKKIETKNIIIIGGGEIGFGVAQKLEALNFKFRLIEQDVNRAKEISDRLSTATILHGDGMSADLLKEERVDSADVLVAACKEDEKNFIICQLSREMGIPKTVAVVEKADYVPLFQKLGVDVTVSPRLIAAQRLSQYVKMETFHSLAVLEEGKAEVFEIEAKEKSKIVSKPLSKLGFPEGCVIGVLVRGKEVIVPRGDTLIEPRDRVIVFTLVSLIPKIKKYFS